jgi:hypothetical protein
VIIADDSQKQTGEAMRKLFPDIEVMVTQKNLGKVAGLYINLANAYKFAIDNYDFPVLLKMDDDALMIGAQPEVLATQLFAMQPDIGMAGRYITGQYSEDCYGNIHDNYWPRKQLIKDTCSWKIIRRPVANLTFRKFFFRALVFGYELGENIQGGAYFISYDCLRQLDREGLLPMQKLGNINFGEDLLFSLLVKSIGMQLGDLAHAAGPIACAWKGLPAAPEKLYNEGKKIIHSIRFWQDMNEDDIRAYYRSCRQKERSTKNDYSSKKYSV